MTQFLLEADNPNSKLYHFMRSYQPMFVVQQAGRNNNSGCWCVIADPAQNEYPYGLEEYCSLVAAQTIYVMDKLLNFETVQVHGLYMLSDSSKTNKNNTKFVLRPDLLKKLVSTIIGLPIRQKGDITIKTSLFYRMLLKGVVPLLPKKTRERMIHLGDKRAELENYLVIEKLPVEYFGQQNRASLIEYFGYQLPVMPVASQPAPTLPTRPAPPQIPQNRPPPVPTRPQNAPMIPARPPVPTRPVNTEVATGNLIEF